MANNERMVPIPIDDLINGMKSPVDLYVKLSEAKFVLIAKEGVKTDVKQLSNYKNKKLDYLWTPFTSFHKWSKQHVAIAGVAVNNNNLSTKAKAKFVASAASGVFSHFSEVGIQRETLDSAQSVSEATVALVESHNELSNILDAFEKYENDMLRHALAVSFISVCIARELGWENKSTLEKVSLGGLLHDIGKLALPPDIVNKPKGLMSFEEIQLYETHAYKGMEMLTSLGCVPDDIVSIVYEHHENSIGQGFPRRFRDVKIHPMAKVVALADEFCNLTMKSPNRPHPINPREALVYIDHVMGQPYNKEAYKALQKVILKEHIEQAS